MGNNDDVHGDYPPGIGDDIGTPTTGDDLNIVNPLPHEPNLDFPTWGDITRAPISHHYYAHRGDTEGHHHHGTDGSVLFHEHPSDFPDHDHFSTFLDLAVDVDWGDADHDHDDTTTSLPPAASDVRT